jgi:hypothetical protein
MIFSLPGGYSTVLVVLPSSVLSIWWHQEGTWPEVGVTVTERIVGAICERIERATLVALDSIVFFSAPI